MPEPTPTATDRRRLVADYITELSRLAQAHAPQAAVEVLSRPHEDEDAHIIVWLPEGVCNSALDTLREALTTRSTEILLEAGLLILAGVYETSQQPKSRATSA